MGTDAISNNYNAGYSGVGREKPKEKTPREETAKGSNVPVGTENSSVTNNKQGEAVGVKQQLNALISKYGISLQEIKDSFGYDCSQFVCGNENLILDVLKHLNKCIKDDKFDKESWEKVKICRKNKLKYDNINFIPLDKIQEAIEYQIKNGGKVSNDNVVKYAIALNYDWDSIDEYNKCNEKNQDSFIECLQKEAGLPQKGNIKDYSEEELKSACKKYFDTTFEKIRQEEYKKGVNSSAFKDNKPKEGVPIEKQIDAWVNKKFRQTLGKLLINSSEKQTRVLAPLIASIKAEYQDKAIQSANAILDAVGDTEKQREFNDQIIQDPNVIDNINQATIVLVAAKTSKDVIEKVSNESNDEKNKFYIDNEEIINVIYEKLKNNQQLSQKEKDIYEQLKKYNDKNVAIVEGLRQNNALTTAEKDYNVAKLRQNTRKASLLAYRDEQIATQNYITSLNISEEEKTAISKFYDKVTNGNFSLVNSNHDIKAEELNPSIEPKEFLPKQPSVGLNQKSELIADIAQKKAEQITYIIESQQEVKEEKKFVLVKEEKKNNKLENYFNIDLNPINLSNVNILNILGVNEVNEKLKNNKLKLQTLFVNYSDLLKPLQQLAENKIKSQSEDKQVEKIDCVDNHSDKVYLAELLKISEENCEKLHLDSYSKQRLNSHNNVA